MSFDSCEEKQNKKALRCSQGSNRDLMIFIMKRFPVIGQIPGRRANLADLRFAPIDLRVSLSCRGGCSKAKATIPRGTYHAEVVVPKLRPLSLVDFCLVSYTCPGKIVSPAETATNVFNKDLSSTTGFLPLCRERATFLTCFLPLRCFFMKNPSF